MAKHYTSERLGERTGEEILRIIYSAGMSHEIFTPRHAVQIWNEIKSGERWKFPFRFLQKKRHRVVLVRALVSEYQEKHPDAYPIKPYFRKNMLGGLLANYYNNSPYRALVEAGFTDRRTTVYDERLDTSSVQRAAKRISRRTGKPVNKLGYPDFRHSDYANIIRIYRVSELREILHDDI